MGIVGDDQCQFSAWALARQAKPKIAVVAVSCEDEPSQPVTSELVLSVLNYWAIFFNYQGYEPMFCTVITVRHSVIALAHHQNVDLQQSVNS